MPMSDKIILEIGRNVMERHGGKPSTEAGLEIGRAIEAAASEAEHARCVRELRTQSEREVKWRIDCYLDAADWLERNPPEGRAIPPREFDPYTLEALAIAVRNLKTADGKYTYVTLGQALSPWLLQQMAIPTIKEIPK